MTEKTTLLRQFAQSFDTNEWFVATANAIKNITAEQAEWKPEGADHSIREIINHLNYYNNAYLQRFKGEVYEYNVADNDETFDIGEAESWEAEAARFDSIMRELRTLLDNADEVKLAELAPPYNEVPWFSLIGNINAHNAHHGGQIVLMRKLQGSWDAAKGVS